MAKKGQKQKKYSVEFKISVILDMLNNNLGYRETVRKYWGTKSRTEESYYRTRCDSYSRNARYRDNRTFR